MVYTVKIEQTYHYPNRMKYISQILLWKNLWKAFPIKETSVSPTAGSKNQGRRPATILMLLL